MVPITLSAYNVVAVLVCSLSLSLHILRSLLLFDMPEWRKGSYTQVCLDLCWTLIIQAEMKFYTFKAESSFKPEWELAVARLLLLPCWAICCSWNTQRYYHLYDNPFHTTILFKNFNCLGELFFWTAFGERSFISFTVSQNLLYVCCSSFWL